MLKHHEQLLAFTIHSVDIFMWKDHSFDYSRGCAARVARFGRAGTFFLDWFIGFRLAFFDLLCNKLVGHDCLSRWAWVKRYFTLLL